MPSKTQWKEDFPVCVVRIKAVAEPDPELVSVPPVIALRCNFEKMLVAKKFLFDLASGDFEAAWMTVMPRGKNDTEEVVFLYAEPKLATVAAAEQTDFCDHFTRAMECAGLVRRVRRRSTEEEVKKD